MNKGIYEGEQVTVVHKHKADYSIDPFAVKKESENIYNKTIKQIIEENNMSKEEAEWLERSIGMMMTLRKHIRLSELK